MNRDDITRMAREAGFIINDENPMTHSLERFAALVAVAEREACAKVCEELAAHTDPSKEQDGYFAAVACTLAIRARGQA